MLFQYFGVVIDLVFDFLSGLRLIFDSIKQMAYLMLDIFPLGVFVDYRWEFESVFNF